MVWNITIRFCKGVTVLLYVAQIFDHPRSDVIYNFGRVCLYVCLSLTLSVRR